MPIQAVIFDMEGTLVDSEPYWKQSREEFARAVGKVWTEDDQRMAMGRSTVGWAQLMKDRLEIDMPVEQIIDDMKRRIIGHYEERLPVLPGAMEAIETARSAYRIALASGSPTQVIEWVMTRTGLDKVFEVIVFGDDIPNGKPAPDIYLETARRLGVKPEACVGIEDSSNGVRSVKAAGMRVVACPSPGFPLPDDVLALADRVLPSLKTFSVDLIQSLEAG